jgi:hypothetical protein
MQVAHDEIPLRESYLIDKRLHNVRIDNYVKVAQTQHQTKQRSCRDPTHITILGRHCEHCTYS